MHLVGSRKDQFYFDLSLVYCKACDSCSELDRARFEFHFAVVHLDDTWSFPTDLEENTMASAKRLSMPQALAHIAALDPDVMVPHMFCVEGMTRFRSLFDLLRIPYLGNREYTIFPATDKATTKQLLAAVGVSVPSGDLLVRGEKEWPTVSKIPCVVKPCNEDNSIGLTFVQREEELADAIELAFKHDSRVVVDDYIAGRELRVAVVECADGSLTVLPKLEYFLENIRTSAHKLKTDANGKLSKNAVTEAKKDGDRQCPADLSPELHRRVDEIAINAHKALNCRHYSLFDLRVDEAGQPYVLEACLFCSFSPVSVIPSMARHAEKEELHHPNFFHSLLERAAAEKPRL
jgi:D-alanine-D-alanine ligase